MIRALIFEESTGQGNAEILKGETLKCSVKD
jgi:hypothetical protein